MAITKEITKVSVRESYGNKAITIKAKVNDNGVEWSSKDFVLDFNAASDLETEIKKLSEKMQEYVDQCVAEINTFHHTKFDIAITWLNANVTVPG
jgi:hypothetical protein